MRIGMIGCGKLGLPVALAIESKGYDVIGYDINPNVAQYLKDRQIPFVEEGLQPLLDKTNLQLAQSIEEVVAKSDIVFCPVQTPHDYKYEGITRVPSDKQDFDYTYLIGAIIDIAAAAKKLKKQTTLAVISTCMPGTFEKYIRPQLNEYIDYVYTPQFIAMGTVLKDYLDPEFALIGVDSPRAAKQLGDFYNTLFDKEHVVTDITTAECIKVSYNTIITMKTVVANIWGEVAQKVGADFDDIFKAWSLSTRRLLSSKYLQAGMGDGGGCHPRDNTAGGNMAEELGLSYDLFTSLMKAREKHTEWLASVIKEAHDRTGYPVTILGRAFKPETDIETGSPALLLMTLLDEMMVEYKSKTRKGPFNETDTPKVYFIATAHEEFKTYPYAKGSLIIDPFGMLEPVAQCNIVRLGRS